MDWLINGRGPMIFEEEIERVVHFETGSKAVYYKMPNDLPRVAQEPSEQEAEVLAAYTLKQWPVELSTRQSLMFKMACAQVLFEHPALQSLEALAVGAKIYLRIIQRMPDINLAALFDLEGAVVVGR